MHMNYSQIMTPRPPLPRKVGGHDPQLLWERRPWIKEQKNCINIARMRLRDGATRSFSATAN